ncbi:MAG: hypothetical protein QOH09_3166 [Pseudonocardiales bacterium]|jgi:hypothetical protein|nr:hypothetical protein [Pseudonocardiales bacterium]
MGAHGRVRRYTFVWIAPVGEHLIARTLVRRHVRCIAKLTQRLGAIEAWTQAAARTLLSTVMTVAMVGIGALPASAAVHLFIRSSWLRPLKEKLVFVRLGRMFTSRQVRH